MEKNHQTEIVETMMQASFYPHPVETIQRRETHISMVFLTGPFVYKIKKPVDLGFLDFTSLEKRQHYCRQEIALNRRLSHGVYLDAVPIARHGGTYTLGGAGHNGGVCCKDASACRHRFHAAASAGRHAG